ncbi:MAG TPA: S16 family serine protease [Streptosporangiaceae bacterium]|nr:S16 family serine protease [Streptosporangiaceae bacterium]
MSRRAVTLLIASVGVIGALLAAALLPVPYVSLMPGPTFNTLGTQSGSQGGKDAAPIIQISGRRTYPTDGHLNMVTVSYIGGPGYRPPFNVFAALQAWLSPHNAVVPQQELFPPGQTQQQVSRQDTEEMANSQQAATAAALCQLGIKFTTDDTIVSTIKGLPAHGVLHAGDVIEAVNGTQVGCKASAASLIEAKPAGHKVTLTISHAGKLSKVTLTTRSSGGEPVIGVRVVESWVFPFKVKITLSNVGGPSAGMMFALGIIDKLTPMNLTNGKFIAGTGEIEADGTVDPIGGIQQKMAAARAAGATVFLTPAANCPDTAGAVPAGLRLVKVSTLSGAIAALQAIKAGRSVPGC